MILAAIIAMYQVAESVVGTSVGSPTPCYLFIIFENELIKCAKRNCNSERFLDWLHILVLMDDTVPLATSRENMINKVKILRQFCADYGTVINNSKTKFFVINGGAGDSWPICLDELIIEQCSNYIYLGSPFTCDGSVSSAVKLHAKNKLCHVLKYVSFIKKNNDIPFIVKNEFLLWLLCRLSCMAVNPGWVPILNQSLNCITGH